MIPKILFLRIKKESAGMMLFPSLSREKGANSSNLGIFCVFQVTISVGLKLVEVIAATKTRLPQVCGAATTHEDATASQHPPT